MTTSTLEGVSDWTSVDPAAVSRREMPGGWSIGLPVVYTDWLWASAFFPAKESEVRKRLPDDSLQPLRLLPGVALAVVGVMKYTTITDVEPYDEMVVGYPVERGPLRSVFGKAAFISPALHPERFHNFGLFVHHLPVSHRRAYEFGVELWGYPKTVVDFSWANTDKTLAATVGASADGSVRGLSLSVPRVANRPMRQEQITYTVQNGELVETPVRMEGKCGLRLFGNGGKLGLGDDPVSRDLASVLISRRPVGTFYAEVARSVLMDAKSRTPLGRRGG
ncbi:MAG: acetoacetate decarboxylase family protein [Isosphaeraceae bacterium]